MIMPTIMGHVVVTRIPAGTSVEERQEALEVARKLAKGASSKNHRYKQNWARQKKLDNLRLL